MPRTMQKRAVFFISDGTGITAEGLGMSLLAHFSGVTFHHVRLPFVDNIDKVGEALLRIAAAQKHDGARAILIMTLVSKELRMMFENSGALCLDIFGGFLQTLATELKMQPIQATGLGRKVAAVDYRKRIEAINFTLGHDDGITDNLQSAEVILIGVSRSGKTPTSLYLAMQFGIRAANYPLIPEDLERMALPGKLGNYRGRIFGLTINPERLHRIRNERRPHSNYASIENCRHELHLAEKLMRREGIRWTDSTTRSVEEIATTVMQQMNLEGL